MEQGSVVRTVSVLCDRDDLDCDGLHPQHLVCREPDTLGFIVGVVSTVGPGFRRVPGPWLVQHGRRFVAAYLEEELMLVLDDNYEQALAKVLRAGLWQDPWNGDIL